MAIFFIFLGFLLGGLVARIFVADCWFDKIMVSIMCPVLIFFTISGILVLLLGDNWRAADVAIDFLVTAIGYIIMSFIRIERKKK